MSIKPHTKLSGFSGNELYCLNELGYQPGSLCLGNNVMALGIIRGLGAGLSTLAGGEITEVTQLVHEGRQAAINRMQEEALQYGGMGLAGVSFNLINHGAYLEFIALGSTIHQKDASSPQKEALQFSTSSTGQALYCQMKAGFTPKRFVFSNIAYSIGLGNSLLGGLKILRRGEIEEFTQIFHQTRQSTISRIQSEAIAVGANAVIGIETTILPLLGTQEMMMVGTAAHHPALREYNQQPITAALTNQELWNVVNLGYMPIRLVIGVSVYSLGFASGIASLFKTLAGGSIETMNRLLYEAREKALSRIEEDAEACGADAVVGVKTRVYDLGSGLIEIMVIGTAIKKMPNIKTETDALIPQAIIQETETFVESSIGSKINLGQDSARSAPSMQGGPLMLLAGIVLFSIFILSKCVGT